MTSNGRVTNRYYDAAAIAAAVGKSEHREVVGGMWNEIGKLQFDFLCARGLQPSSRLVDIGCGCLRGGVHFIKYLDAENYYGIDINQSLLDAGYDVELGHQNLQDKLPRANLVCDGEFGFSRLPVLFHFALAQSLFTHLPANHLQMCLARLAPSMEPNGALFATFFIVPDEHPIGVPFDHLHGVRSFDGRDPYHYRAWQIRNFCDGLSWSVVILDDWNHPRDQRMVRFQPNPVAAPIIAGEDRALRSLEIADASNLPPGANHYRAYVGPPDRYDFMSSSQFALLFALGLRDTHRVLDFGCGSLRLGRLLIPFLQPERYFGIDPNHWLVADAVARELGSDAIRIKRPSFSSNDDFRCDVFGASFDYIVAQSILTHCGYELAEVFLREMGAALMENGKIVFSIIEAPLCDERPGQPGWTYPACVRYGQSTISALCEQVGLTCRRLPWYHPGATWYIAAGGSEHLPSDDEMSFLRGAVLFEPQFAASRRP